MGSDETLFLNNRGQTTINLAKRNRNNRGQTTFFSEDSRQLIGVCPQFFHPLEGRYEIYLGDKGKNIETIMTSRIEQARDTYRVSSLSADPTNFLMWSHYADGYKGIVLEVEVPEIHPDLTKVTYTVFSSVFTDKLQTKEDMKHLFNGKGEEWEYEQEYRIITEEKYFDLPEPIGRVLLGPLVSDEQALILERVVPERVEIVRMELDRTQGTLMVNSPNKTIKPTPAPLRFADAAEG